jgi:two-component system, cell cycle sensor histidine kinase and response regulator CckA
VFEERAEWNQGPEAGAGSPTGWLDRIPAPAAVLSRQGMVLACNDEAVDLFGWTGGAPGSFGGGTRWLERVIVELGRTGRARTVISRRSGPRRLAIELRCHLLDHDEVLILFRDCTAQVVGRKVRRSGEHHLRGFLDRLPEPVLIEQDGVIAYCNAGLAALAGVADPALLRGEPVTHVLPADVYARIRKMVDAPSGPHASELEVTIAPAGNGLRTLRISTLPLQYRRRPAVQLLLRDITAQRQAEDGLRASHARLLAITEGVRDHAIITLDSACRITSWNAAAERMTGYGAEATAGADVGMLFAEPLHAEAPLFNASRTDGRGSAEATLRRSDGESVPAQLTVSSLLDPAHETIGFAVIVHDLSERRRVEESLRRSEEQLQHAQKMDAVGRLAAGVAHDFNNMITAIQGHVQFILEDLPADSPAREDAVEIRRAAERATDLTRQLLTFARRQSRAPQPLDLNSVVLDVQKLLRRLLRADIELVTDLSADLPPGLADRGELEQVIVNIVVNARDAMPSGGAVTLRTTALTFAETYTARGLVLEPGHYVVLSITDTGAGMSPAVQQQVFEPFFTTKAEGTGLGLATAYGIVKRAGGHISIYSEEGTGTTFKVFLRTTEPVEAPDSALSPQCPVAAGRVLVVDDDEALRTLATSVLGEVGLDVITAASGEEALAALAADTSHLDVIVTDLMMPRMSGDRLAQSVCEQFPDAGVVLTSGFPEDTLPEGTLHQRRERFLEKPFTPLALIAAVREVLPQRPHG